MDNIHHGLGHATGYGEAPARRRTGVLGIGGILQGFEIHVLRLEHALQFLKGQHKVHVGADVLPDGLQLLGGAGADEDNLGLRLLPLHHPGGVYHGGQGHGDVLGLGGEELVHHGVPGRAAGGGHEGLVGRDVFHKVLGLLHGADVRTDGNLHHIGKAQLPQGGYQLGEGDILAKLPGKGRGENGNHLVPLHNGAHHLVNLAFVHNGTKGAADQTLAAGHAFLLVDGGPAVLVRPDGIHSAGRLAGPLQVDNGVVGAGLGAFAAADALGRVDAALAVDEGDGLPGAHLLAGGGQTVLAHVRHPVPVGGAGVAGIGNDVHQGRLIVLLGDGGMVHALGH